MFITIDCEGANSEFEVLQVDTAVELFRLQLEDTLDCGQRVTANVITENGDEFTYIFSRGDSYYSMVEVEDA